MTTATKAPTYEELAGQVKRLRAALESAEAALEQAQREAYQASDAADDLHWKLRARDGGPLARAAELAHEGHDRFPWRMCNEEVCRLLQEATGRNAATG